MFACGLRGFKKAKSGVEDNASRGRLKPSVTSDDVVQIREHSDNERHITLRDIHERVDCSIGKMHRIVREDINGEYTQDCFQGCCQTNRNSDRSGVVNSL